MNESKTISLHQRGKIILIRRKLWMITEQFFLYSFPSISTHARVVWLVSFVITYQRESAKFHLKIQNQREQNRERNNRDGVR